MGRYDPLRDYLREQQLREVSLTFAEIEKIVGHPLPSTARSDYRHRRVAWWTNEAQKARAQVQCRAWLDAGYTAHAGYPNPRVTFRKATVVARGAEQSDATALLPPSS